MSEAMIYDVLRQALWVAVKISAFHTAPAGFARALERAELPVQRNSTL